MTGYIVAITGPMFAGKTTKLVELLNEGAKRGNGALFIRSALDSRKKLSHNDEVNLGLNITVKVAERLLPLKEEFISFDAIGIDEGQFFPDLVPAVLAMAAHDALVIVAGLALDAEGRPFGQMPLLLAHADKVITLRAKCAICWAPASMTRYKGASPKEGQILVGGKELYEPVCWGCWRSAFNSSAGRR